MRSMPTALHIQQFGFDIFCKTHSLTLVSRMACEKVSACPCWVRLCNMLLLKSGSQSMSLLFFCVLELHLEICLTTNCTCWLGHALGSCLFQQQGVQKKKKERALLAKSGRNKSQQSVVCVFSSPQVWKCHDIFHLGSKHIYAYCTVYFQIALCFFVFVTFLNL